MRGRVTRHHTWEEVHAYYSLICGSPTNLEPAYTVAPTQDVPMVTSGDP